MQLPNRAGPHTVPPESGSDVETPAPLCARSVTRRGRPKSENSKQLVTLRLPPEVVEGYRASGTGWQVRMGEVLAAGLQGKRPKRTHVTPATGKALGPEAVKPGLTGRYAVVRQRALYSKAKGKPKSA